MIAAKKNNQLISYVGYTNNLNNRLKKHNTGKGAKSTRGLQWFYIFSKKFKTKKDAMKYEYFLKKNRSLRSNIKKKYLSRL
ncbi:MAG: excinuclease ABC subunit C [Candidatus Pelagibacter sp.]|nr:excinuclease ABC subunit C [Candidatus Pelagibacter sp.]|tara:strand:- start:916 stop:1158 length:243 start_codon:yes stop_codon:yes gene_type:complete